VTQQLNMQNGQSQSQSGPEPRSLQDQNLPEPARRDNVDDQSRGEADPDQDIERGPGPERQRSDEPYTTF
jgi:hypothetical protein